MNERIRKLAEQAGAVFTDVHAVSLLDDEIEKFAELIIRKCAEVAWYNTPDWEELEYGHLIEDKILKHFGVEE
jgi:hypothetical protein